MSFLASRSTAAGQVCARRAFTLIELLVVIVVVAILAALLFPAFNLALEASRKGACISNLQQIGAGIAAYAADHNNQIPYGPKAPPFTSPSDLYPSTGAPTSLISIRGGAPVALGLLLNPYLAKNPQVLFCPGCDQQLSAQAQLANVGITQAQGGYYYRHGGNTQLFDSPNMPAPPIQLNSLGNNRNGIAITALVMDTDFLCPSGLASFGVTPLSSHHQKYVNVLYTDGHVTSHLNTSGQYTVNVSSYSQLDGSFNQILTVFETADANP